MGKLQNIKTLRLRSCILEITDGAVCAPVELDLRFIYFSRNDFKINVVKLNDLFDFRNLKDIYLNSRHSDNFELDLSEGALKLNNLVYKNFNAEKQKSSKWTVRKLRLYTETEYTSPTGMVFEELSFDGPALDAEILPTTLRILEMDGTDVKLLHKKAVENLVNLKYLLFNGTTSSNLSAFRNCANLTHLHLCARYDEFESLFTINVKLIPKTVKVFRLSDEYVLLGKIDSEMETVIMENISLEDAYLYLKENFSENLKNVLIFCPKHDDQIVINKLMKELSLRRYILGPLFQTGHIDFHVHFFKADFCIKMDNEAAVIKQYDKTEIVRLIDAWWTDDNVSF
ncbi:hypothetical protein Bhyg_09327 [Pseudolycoriella hygida]|uniref:Uncharacterized protein n=1 Tax=Pseudolycoriella hygida TaxID=35572 RepID=A0A9Q0N6F5_9DIPT|nr:hypothetical protein Bhyg_09327 [Pseudolycoriella hygida]